MELVFICFDILAIAVSVGYAKCGLRGSAMVTLLLGALTLVRVTVIRWIGVACIAFITLCFVLFRTALGRHILMCFGRDEVGRKIKKDQ